MTLQWVDTGAYMHKSGLLGFLGLPLVKLTKPSQLHRTSLSHFLYFSLYIFLKSHSHACICMAACTHTCVHTHACICVPACTHTCDSQHSHMYTCMCTYMHTHMYMHTYIGIHAHMHTEMCCTIFASSLFCSQVPSAFKALTSFSTSLLSLQYIPKYDVYCTCY